MEFYILFAGEMKVENNAFEWFCSNLNDDSTDTPDFNVEFVSYFKHEPTNDELLDAIRYYHVDETNFHLVKVVVDKTWVLNVDVVLELKT